MEKILQHIGRFLGEKFALIDRIYAKKGEVPEGKGGGVTTVNGYVDMLPPRPVKGDRYIIRPENTILFTGIYYLNFGFNRKKDFRIIGDKDAQATLNKNWAYTSGNGIKTGLIPFQGSLLKIYVGVEGMGKHSNLTITVEEYNVNDEIIKSSVCKISGLVPENFIPDGNAKKIKIHITGTVPIAYIKIWEGNPDIPVNPNLIYFFNGENWENETVAEGSVLGVKGKTFLLNQYGNRFQVTELNNIPKIEVKEGVLTAGVGTKIPLKNPVLNDDYFIRYFCRRRRWCSLFSKKRIHKNKYFECTHKRIYVDSFSKVRWKQQAVPPLFSKFKVPVEIGKPITEIPIMFGHLVFLVFTAGGYIPNEVEFKPTKYYPSNGFIGKRERGRKEGLYADFAVCLSKKINGKWKNGEMCYFRLCQIKEIPMLAKTSVRLLKG